MTFKNREEMENKETLNRDRASFACVDPTYLQKGLTKREYFAGLAMQGLLSGRTEHENPMIDVKLAVEMADELLKALEK